MFGDDILLDSICVLLTIGIVTYMVLYSKDKENPEVTSVNILPYFLIIVVLLVCVYVYNLFRPFSNVLKICFNNLLIIQIFVVFLLFIILSYVKSKTLNNTNEDDEIIEKPEEEVQKNKNYNLYISLIVLFFLGIIIIFLRLFKPNCIYVGGIYFYIIYFFLVVILLNLKDIPPINAGITMWIYIIVLVLMIYYGSYAINNTELLSEVNIFKKIILQICMYPSSLWNDLNISLFRYKLYIERVENDSPPIIKKFYNDICKTLVYFISLNGLRLMFRCIVNIIVISLTLKFLRNFGPKRSEEEEDLQACIHLEDNQNNESSTYYYLTSFVVASILLIITCIVYIVLKFFNSNNQLSSIDLSKKGLQFALDFFMIVDFRDKHNVQGLNHFYMGIMKNVYILQNEYGYFIKAFQNLKNTKEKTITQQIKSFIKSLRCLKKLHGTNIKFLETYIRQHKIIEQNSAIFSDFKNNEKCNALQSFFANDPLNKLKIDLNNTPELDQQIKDILTKIGDHFFTNSQYSLQNDIKDSNDCKKLLNDSLTNYKEQLEQIKSVIKIVKRNKTKFNVEEWDTFFEKINSEDNKLLEYPNELNKITISIKKVVDEASKKENNLLADNFTCYAIFLVIHFLILLFMNFPSKGTKSEQETSRHEHFLMLITILLIAIFVIFHFVIYFNKF